MFSLNSFPPKTNYDDKLFCGKKSFTPKTKTYLQSILRQIFWNEFDLKMKKKNEKRLLGNIFGPDSKVTNNNTF